MHQEAWNWLSEQIRPALEDVTQVLDIGGNNVNGTPRDLFSIKTEYNVIDNGEGNNVDIVADATSWLPSQELHSHFDVVLCTKVFEHVEHWQGIVYNMWLTAKPGGNCLITCATDPRPPHSIVGIEPPPNNEWYRNVPINELLQPVRFLFSYVDYATHPRGDLYIKAVK